MKVAHYRQPDDLKRKYDCQGLCDCPGSPAGSSPTATGRPARVQPCKPRSSFSRLMVRWKEAVWVEKGSYKKKLIKVGERRMTAEVPATDRKGFVCLSVCKCDVLANLAARVLEPFKKEESVRRARRTIGREVAKGSRGAMKTRGRM